MMIQDEKKNNDILKLLLNYINYIKLVIYIIIKLII